MTPYSYRQSKGVPILSHLLWHIAVLFHYFHHILLIFKSFTQSILITLSYPPPLPPRSTSTFQSIQLCAISPLPFPPSSFPSLFLSHSLNPLSPISGTQLLLRAGPALRCGWLTRGHTTRENSFSFSQHQLNVNNFSASCGTLSSPPCWDFVSLCFESAVHVISQPLWDQLCNFPVVSRKYSFLKVIHQFQLLQSFLPFHNNCEPWSEMSDIIIVGMIELSSGP